MKKCSRCHEDKPLDCFYVRKGYGDGYYGQCRACQSELRRRKKITIGMLLNRWPAPPEGVEI